ncbi:MAG TPA: DUF4157 domain-containing protein [Thermoanaerobaculia bacterium]|jgi:aminoglycoside phosphotransferase
MRKEEPSASGGPGLCPKCEEERRLHGASPGIQRRCAECEAKLEGAEEDEEETVQRKPVSSGPVPPGLSLPVPDSGSPLSGALRQRIEPVLGTDLSGVRVHASPAARESARSLKAKAFTHRDHIWLGPGQSADDAELMAHEATHVVQQTAGADGPKPIQRAPADYRHPEDGGSVLSRMHARMEDELGEAEADEAVGPGTAAAGVAPEKSGPAERSAADPEAQQAVREIDQERAAALRSEIEPQARPDVDRPTQELPRVEAAATATEEEAQSPSKPLVEGEQPAAGPEASAGAAGASAGAEVAVSLAERAFARAEAQPIPMPESTVAPPPPLAPVNAAGMPLPVDPALEIQMMDLSAQAQALRDGGQSLREQAGELRSNAQIVQGNMALVGEAVGQSEQGVSTSRQHLETRLELVGQARQALDLSEQKAAMVAEQAPGFQSQATEGKGDSGPLASEAGQMAGESRSHVPDDDPEAQAQAQQQSQDIEHVGSDASTMDGAIAQAEQSAGSLSEEAAQATQTNAQTQGKMEAMDAALGETDQRLAQMQSQNDDARGQLDSLRDQPGQIMAQADELDAQGVALIQASVALEIELRQAQNGFLAAMRSIPAEENAGRAEGAAPVGLIQKTPEEGTYDQRVNLRLDERAPSWLTGREETDPGVQQRRAAEESARLGGNFAEIQRRAGGHFESLSFWDKAGIAGSLTLSNLGQSVSNISFPGWGHLARGLVDPRIALSGVISGLSMSLSGVANLLPGSGQWSGNPLASLRNFQQDIGNVLKSATDIATGLTIILGSITAAAAVIAGLLTVLSIVTFGTLAPILGPIIAFCAAVMTTVGGWTIAVGKIALILQGLVFLKNLVDAGTATSANDLLNQSEQMTQDVKNAGNVVLQIAMAKLGQIGGRQLGRGIRAAGGGVRYAGGSAARAANTFGSLGRGIAELGSQGIEGGVWSGAGRLFRGAGREIMAETPASLRGGGVFNADFLVGEGIAPGWSGLRAAAQQGRQMAALEPLVSALQTPAGQLNQVALAQLLERVPTLEATSTQGLQELAARTLGMKPGQILIEPIQTPGAQQAAMGISGAPVYLVRGEGGGLLAVIKVFPSGQIGELGQELSAMQWLNRGALEKVGSARPLSVSQAGGEGVLVSSAAPGDAFRDLLQRAGAATGAERAAALAELRTALQRNGRAIAELHTAASGMAPTAAIEGHVAAAQDITNQLVGRINEGTLPGISAQQLQARIDELVAGVRSNPGAAGVTHGDLNIGNVFYDPGRGITVIDLSRLPESLGSSGTLGVPARDLLVFEQGIGTFGQRFGLTSSEVADLQATFRTAYLASSGAGITPQALAFFRARAALGSLIAALNRGATGPALQIQIDAFKAALGL